MSGRIPLAGVVGHPVAHSRSPALHGHWLRRYGLAGHYVPLDVAPGNLAEAMAALPRLGFVGCNVTIPHKVAVLDLADTVSDRARAIGAANTLVFGPDGLAADNTDGEGFIENLRRNAPGWSATDGPAVVLGAGGAARAVVTALLAAGAPEIRVANRTAARAEALRDAFGARVTVHDWDRAGDIVSDAGLVANTTSLGMTGQPPFDVPLDRLSPGAVATDLVYTPLDTTFLSRARAAGCRTVDGLGMLLYQAVPGFEAWFGLRPEVDEDLRRAVLPA